MTKIKNVRDLKVSLSLVISFLFISIICGCNPAVSENPEDWLDSGSIDIGYEDMGHVTVVSGDDSKPVRGSESGDFHYTTVKENGQEFLVEFVPVAPHEVKTRKVMFDGALVLPAAYPGSFELNDRRFLLFGYGRGVFELYGFASQNDTYSFFEADASWDFTAITGYVTGIMYKGENSAWILCPEYNEVRHSLYFTLCYWVEDAVKGDYIIIRVYESRLVGETFQAPVEARGEINPYHPVHYKDNKWHNVGDFPGRMGIWWIGRLAMTGNGNKAFFTVLSIVYDDTIMKLTSPYNAPVPNNQHFGDSGIESVRDPRIIWTYICSADVNAAGEFVNIKHLSPAINRGGINYLCDIDNSGSKLYVNHMNITTEFWESWGPGGSEIPEGSSWWGPDGIALACCDTSPYNLEPWSGRLEIVRND